MSSKSLFLLVMLIMASSNAAADLVCYEFTLPDPTSSGSESVTLFDSFGVGFTLDFDWVNSDLQGNGVYNIGDIFEVDVTSITPLNAGDTVALDFLQLDISGFDGAPTDTFSGTSDVPTGNGLNQFAQERVFINPVDGEISISPTVKFQFSVVPEASTYMMFGLFGLIGLVCSKLGWRATE